MNVFEIFGKSEYVDTKLLFHNGCFYTPAQVKDIVAPLVYKLLQNPCKNVLLTSKNSFDFYIHFLAAAFAKKEIILFSDEKKLHTINIDYIKPDEYEPMSLNAYDRQHFDDIDTKNIFINFYTSGSSAAPKGVRKSLKNLILESSGVCEELKHMLTFPLMVTTSTLSQHMFGMTNFMMMSMCHAGQIILDTKEVLYPDGADLENKIFVSSPSFLEKFKKYDVDLNQAPRLVITAGDKLKDEVFEYFSTKNISVCEIYGSTESGVIAYKTKPRQDFFKCFSDVVVSADKDSQIRIKSPYFLEEECVLNDIIELCDEKTFKLKNRNDRVVKIQEKRVSLVEMESILLNSGILADAYCFKFGEKLACAAVLNDCEYQNYIDNPPFIIKSLKALFKNRSEIVPQKWRFLYEIPKTKTGKTDKEKIKSYFEINLSMPFVTDIKKSQDEVSYELVFLKNSNFFDGHFENFPILPGVVQLYFAHRFAQDAFEIEINENSAKKVKFSNIIKPNEKLQLCFKKSGSNISYAYKKGGATCSSGVFSVKDLL